MTPLLISPVPSRRQFLHHALWSAFGLWAGAGTLQAAADGLTHVVKRGDTLSELARAHGVTVAAIKGRNGLKSDMIRIGQTLIIPGAAVSGDVALAPVIAATKRVRVDSDRWRYVVAHHSGIEAGNAKAYGSAHRRRGMEHGLAYHFVIGNGRDSGDGEIEVGPRWIHQLRGGHVRDQNVNATGIGVCLVGNFQNHPPSARQLASFHSLMDWLHRGHVSSRCTFSVHRWIDRNHTVCPGRHFPYADMKRRYT